MEMASHKAEEKKEQPEKPKEAVVRGIPCKGVIVASGSGDGFGRKEFSAAELEAAVRHGWLSNEAQSGLWGLQVGQHNLKF